MNECCKTCCYWRPSSRSLERVRKWELLSPIERRQYAAYGWADKPPAMDGECHRHSPKHSVEGYCCERIALWLTVFEDDFCGDYAAKEEGDRE